MGIPVRMLRLKWVPLSLILLAACVTLMPHSLESAEMRIAADGAYRLWRPAWSGGKTTIYHLLYGKMKAISPAYPLSHSYRYGPSLTFRFLEAWEIGASFSYSRLRMAVMGPMIMPGQAPYIQMATCITRHDIHATLGYYLAPFCKIFGGTGVEIVKYKNRLNILNTHPEFNLEFGSLASTQLHFLPEIGASFPIPLSSFFMPILSASAIFLSGSDKTDMKPLVNIQHPNLDVMTIPVARYYALGAKLSAAALFTIPSAHLSFGMGVSYRALRFFQKASDEGWFRLNRSWEHITDFYATASCFFSIEPKKRRIWIPRPSHE